MTSTGYFHFNHDDDLTFVRMQNPNTSTSTLQTVHPSSRDHNVLPGEEENSISLLNY